MRTLGTKPGPIRILRPAVQGKLNPVLPLGPLPGTDQGIAGDDIRRLAWGPRLLENSEACPAFAGPLRGLIEVATDLAMDLAKPVAATPMSPRSCATYCKIIVHDLKSFVLPPSRIGSMAGRSHPGLGPPARADRESARAHA